MRQTTLIALFPLVLAILLAGCAGRGEPSRKPEARKPEGDPGNAAAAPWFVERALDLGLDSVNDPGPEGSFFLPQSMGNGAALIDFDQDGRLDL